MRGAGGAVLSKFLFLLPLSAPNSPHWGRWCKTGVSAITRRSGRPDGPVLDFPLSESTSSSVRACLVSTRTCAGPRPRRVLGVSDSTTSSSWSGTPGSNLPATPLRSSSSEGSTGAVRTWDERLTLRLDLSPRLLPRSSSPTLGVACEGQTLRHGAAVVPLRPCSTLSHFPGFLEHHPARRGAPDVPNRGVSGTWKWNTTAHPDAAPLRPVGAFPLYSLGFSAVSHALTFFISPYTPPASRRDFPSHAPNGGRASSDAALRRADRRPNTVRRAPAGTGVTPCETTGTAMKARLCAGQPRERMRRTRRPESAPLRPAGGPGRVRAPGTKCGAGSSRISPGRPRPVAQTHRATIRRMLKAAGRAQAGTEPRRSRPRASKPCTPWRACSSTTWMFS